MFSEEDDKREYIKRCKNARRNLSEVIDYLKHIEAPWGYVTYVNDASDIIDNLC